MTDWIIRDRSVVFTARRWAVERSIRSRRGRPGEHEFFTVRMPDFVNVVALTGRDEVVMVRQFRHGVERHTLEMPGGLIDQGESDPLAAARRELSEETGYDGPLTPLGEVYPNPALLSSRCYFFLASPASLVAPPSPEETEDGEVVLVPRDEIDARIASGEIANALMIAGLALWRLRGR